MYQRYYDGYECINDSYDYDQPQCIDSLSKADSSKNIFGNLKNDDILLIGVLILLLSGDCDDKMLLIIIGYLFISGLK